MKGKKKHSPIFMPSLPFMLMRSTPFSVNLVLGRTCGGDNKSWREEERQGGNLTATPPTAPHPGSHCSSNGELRWTPRQSASKKSFIMIHSSQAACSGELQQHLQLQIEIAKKRKERKKKKKKKKENNCRFHNLPWCIYNGLGKQPEIRK